MDPLTYLSGSNQDEVSSMVLVSYRSISLLFVTYDPTTPYLGWDNTPIQPQDKNAVIELLSN
jgi:hypothetical protein